MPFCPECKYEYHPETSECPDCGRRLVDRLPEIEQESLNPKGRFKSLPSLPGRVYAELVKGALEAKGIPCYIRSDGIIDTLGISGTGPLNRGAKLFVPEDRYEECLQIQHGMLDHI